MKMNLYFNKAVTVIALLIITVLSGCKDESTVEPIPEEPIVETITGKAVAESGFSMIDTPFGAGIRIRDNDTGIIYSVSMNGHDPGYGDNATMMLSETDVITDQTKFELIPSVRGTSAAVVARPTKEFTCTITFYPNWKENEEIIFKSGGRLYDLKKVQFTCNVIAIGDMWRPILMDYLYAKPTEFRKMSVDIMTQFNDANPYKEGNQPQAIYAAVAPYEGPR